MRWRPLVVLLAACTAPRASRTGEDPSAARPGAARLAPAGSHPDDVVGDAVTRNAACEGCHAREAVEWRGSLHRASHSDAAYQRAFALEPLPFCTACHAPEASPESPEPVRAALGVGCVTCHERGRATRSCASCHEFDFPDGHAKMQLTATEHRASRHRDRSCTDCHMPKRGGSGGGADHRWASSRDETWLRRAARVDAVRTNSGVTFRFAPRDVGHAFPTGDLFRRLRAVVEVDGVPDASAEVVLSRKTKLGTVRDDRLFVDGAAREVDVAVAASSMRGRVVRWRVLYERVQHPTTADEASAEVEASIPIASGEL